MKLKEFLIRHGEKIALIVVIFLLVVLFFVRRVKVGPIPDLAEMANEIEERIKKAEDDPPDHREVAKVEELANRSWLELVKLKMKHPVDDTPAEDLGLPETDWTPRPRPKAARPGIIRMRAPVELAAEGKPGAVMLKWRGPSEWSFRTDLSDLGIRPQDQDPGKPIEPALYQITSAGVVKIEGFILSRAAPGSDNWTDVSDELLPVLDLVPKAMVTSPEGGMGPGMGPYDGRPGGGGYPPEAGGVGGGYVDPVTGVMRGPARPGGPLETGTAAGMPGPDYGMVGPGARAGGRQGQQTLPQVEFRCLDRNVTPGNKYVYRAKVLGEVIKAAELPKSEDPDSQENKNRLKVGDPAQAMSEGLKEPVEVLADTMLACMGGRESRATIVVYKCLVDDDGNTQFARERFTVRIGQQIGHVMKTTVRSQESLDQGRDRRGPLDMDAAGPMDDPEMMRGARGRGTGPMDDPAMMRGARGGGTGGPMDDDPAMRAMAASRGGERGPMDDPAMRGMPPDFRGVEDGPGRLRQSLEEEKEVDFATGSILLDIVMEATEVALPEREGAERTTRSPGRRQYKIVVVDRHNLLHDYWKITASEFERQVREFAGGAPVLSRKQPSDRPRARRTARSVAGPAAESPGSRGGPERERSAGRAPRGGRRDN